MYRNSKFKCTILVSCNILSHYFLKVLKTKSQQWLLRIFFKSEFRVLLKLTEHQIPILNVSKKLSVDSTSIKPDRKTVAHAINLKVKFLPNK